MRLVQKALSTMANGPTPVATPDCVPARMVNEYAYCPRLAYIEWVQGDFADNAYTVDGTYRHRNVDREAGDLPESPQEGETIHARSVWLSAPSEHLTARVDLIEGTGPSVSPVDYKRGTIPDNPERSFEPERVQLCAQGLVLRANGYQCHGGTIYYSSSKTRVDIAFDDALVQRTRSLVKALREAAASARIPPPLTDSPKCAGCSLAGICLPDETNLLQADAACTDEGEEGVRRLMPARDDALPLYVQEQGAYVGKKGNVVTVHLKGTKLGEARLFETSQVALFGNVQVTSQAMREFLARGIPVTFFSTGGWFMGIAHGMAHKNIELRLSQYQAAGDGPRSLALATTFVTAKIQNCRTMLMRNHRQPDEDVLRGLAKLADDARKAASLPPLLGIEGMAARLYYSCFDGMIKKREEEGEWSFDFDRRNRRPPLDPVNALLSYAYALLAKDLTVAALAVGFDPYLGFYHQPRYGRPALALDVMEEFRSIVADSVVLWAVNNGVLTARDFIRRGPAAALTPDARKKFIQAYEKRMDVLITHPVFGYRISYRRVLEVQLRLLGRALAGEIPQYPAFTTR